MSQVMVGDLIAKSEPSSIIFAQALVKEGQKRLRMITVVRTVALVGILGIVSYIAPLRTLPHYFNLIALFAVSGWVNYAISLTRWNGAWRDYCFVAADFALLTFVLIVPAPDTPIEFPDVFFLRFDGFDYLYVFLAGLSISLRPWLVVWGGIAGAVSWICGLFWLAQDTTVFVGNLGNPGSGPEQALLNSASPNFMDLNVQIQGLAIFIIVSAIIAFAVDISLRLVRRLAAQERRAINLSRYLPREIIDELADQDAPFGAERATKAAILFTDVVGFSRVAERVSPQEVIALLRQIHEMVETEVFAHGGMLDKFIGDGAMATFGVAGDQVDAAKRAVACAKAISVAADVIIAPDSKQPVQVAVGVHFGQVVVGDVGSVRRMEFAVIGDTVNVAARLEGMTRNLGVRAAISLDAYEAAGRPIGFTNVGPQPVRGREEMVEVWVV